MEKLIVASKNKGKIAEIKAILGTVFDVVSMSDVGIDLDIEETGSTFTENALIKAKTLFMLTGLPSLADDSGLEVEALGGRPGVFSARYAVPPALTRKNHPAPNEEAFVGTPPREGNFRDTRVEENFFGTLQERNFSIDRANNQKLLAEMIGINDRRAKFVCVIALIKAKTDNGGYERTVGQGNVHGDEDIGKGKFDAIIVRGEAHGEILRESRGGGGFGYDPLFYSFDLQKSFGEASSLKKNAASHRYRALKDLLAKLDKDRLMC
ncbi:MAG: non-canonical purine NTP pyrophosphatase [Firmicutes bacterium]|nr:non-canonical purine NTP pyrophosphatase [Bacillota bacterium]